MARQGQNKVVAGVLAAIALIATVVAPATAGPGHDRVVSDDPADFTPSIRDAEARVLDFAEWGDLIVVGGDFQTIGEVGGPDITQPFLFAFDRATGAIDPDFRPVLDREVLAIEVHPDGDSVFVGGRFNNVNGEPRKGLVRLDQTGQRVSGFAGRSTGAVFDLEVSGDRLFIGGNLSRINATPVTVLAVVDVDTGQVDPSVLPTIADPRSAPTVTGSLSIDTLSVSSDGTLLVIAGNFGAVDGEPRHQVAVIDVSGPVAELHPFATLLYEPMCNADRFPANIEEVDIDPTDTYFVAVTNGGYTNGPPTACDTAIRFDFADNGEPYWVTYNGGDSYTAVEITESVVYVGGHQRWTNNPFRNNLKGPGAVDRPGISAYDPVNGLPLPWNPGRQPRGLGAWALMATAEGLWIGSDTCCIAGEVRPFLHLMPLVGGAEVKRAAPIALPADLFLATDGQITAAPVAAGAGTGSVGTSTLLQADGRWADVAGATTISGALYHGRADNQFSLVGWSASGPEAGRARVDLLGLPFRPADLTALAYEPGRGRIYYAYDGDTQLRWRSFEPAQSILGALEYVIDVPFDVAGLRGLAIADGVLVHGSTTGDLTAWDTADGQAIPGTARVISGPGDDGRIWNAPGLFFDSAGSVFFPPEPPIRSDATVSGTIADGPDSWKPINVDVASAGDLVVRVEQDDPAADLNVFLLDPTLSIVSADYSRGATDRTLVVPGAAAGRWRVGLSAKSGTTGFRVIVNPADPGLLPGVEPAATLIHERCVDANGDFWNAKRIEYGVAGPTRIEVSWDGPAELYAFLIAPDGTTIAGDRAGVSPAVIDTSIPAAGSYRLGVRAATGAACFTAVVDEVPNAAPELAPVGPSTATVGDPVTVTVTASDTDGDLVTYSAFGLPAGLTIDPATGEISGAPTESGSIDSVVGASDGRGGRAYRTLSWQVNNTPVALWTFDGDAIDQTGNGNSGAVSAGAVFVPGRTGAGQAIELDGDESVIVAHSDDLAVGVAGAATVSMWVNVQEDADGTGLRNYFQKGTERADREMSLISERNSLRVRYAVSTDLSTQDFRTSESQLPLGEWVHVAWVMTGERQLLYIDGQLDSDSFVGGRWQASLGDLHIGNTPWRPGVAGWYDDVAVYDVALSEAEILDLAGIGAGD